MQTFEAGLGMSNEIALDEPQFFTFAFYKHWVLAHVRRFKVYQSMLDSIIFYLSAVRAPRMFTLLFVCLLPNTISMVIKPKLADVSFVEWKSSK